MSAPVNTRETERGAPARSVPPRALAAGVALRAVLARVRAARPSGQLLALLALLALVILVQHGAKLRALDFGLRYEGDGLQNAIIVKSILDAGWFPWKNDLIGAPFGSSPFDFPMSDAVHFLLIKFLGLFGDWVFVSNAFLLAGYFLSAITAFWVLSRMGLGGPWPMLGALLFALASYHPLRAGHLFLASYFVVPLGVWLAWTVWNPPDAAAARRDRRATAIAAVLAGGGGIYYAVFSCYLVFVAMLAALSGPQRFAALRRGAIILALTGATVVATTLPSVFYKLEHGPNPEVATRPFADTEQYGLKLIQLVLPRAGHRVEAFDAIQQRYAAVSQGVNENRTSSLGILASLGLLILLWNALKRLYATARDDRPMECLSTLALACILLATVGGLGAVISFVVSPQIRAYNRISIVIAFLALAGFLFAASRLLSSIRAHDRFRPAIRSIAARPMASWICAAGLLLVGIFDQTSGRDLLPARRTFESDRAFVRSLERALPAGAMVYQMPYHRYPEAGEQFELENYGPARGYLHSDTLRWSYGHVKGREGDRWMLALKDLPVPRQMEVAAKTGFAAVVVDRRGYPDRGKGAEAQLRAALGPSIDESRDGMLVAYRIAPDARPVPPAALLAPFERIDFTSPALPPSVKRASGLSVPEPWGRWTEGPVMSIELAEPLPTDFVLEIETVMAFHPNVNAPIIAAIGGVEREFRVGPQASRAELRFRLEKPASSLQLRIPRPTSPAELGFSGDSRKLGIGLKSIALRAP